MIDLVEFLRVSGFLILCTIAAGVWYYEAQRHIGLWSLACYAAATVLLVQVVTLDLPALAAVWAGAHVVPVVNGFALVSLFGLLALMCVRYWRG